MLCLSILVLFCNTSNIWQIFKIMGTICVIHGENNVGKSNVLEAMQLFFQLLQKKDGVKLDQSDFKASEIFTL
jgi:AAA15 family ATPase/GTPase